MAVEKVVVRARAPLLLASHERENGFKATTTTTTTTRKKTKTPIHTETHSIRTLGGKNK